MLILLGMYFDAAVVFVTSQTLLFRLALAHSHKSQQNQNILYTVQTKGTIQPGLRLVLSGNFFLALNRSHHFL